MNKRVNAKLAVFRQSPNFKKISSGITILLFTATGTFLLLTSKAATPFVSVEPELGSLNGVATINDQSASGGKAVQFGTVNKANAISDADWIMDAVIQSGPMQGAIANYPDAVPQHIRPYQAGFAALGLARATQISGNKNYVNAVWGWLNWYQNHMDGSNYVHDWDLVSGTWQAAPNASNAVAYDSTDSYAALFLVAAKAAYAVDPDMVKLQALKPGITKALAAIRSTQQTDGLTWALPVGYPVKLLEDNAEVFVGLKASISLANTLGDAQLASTVTGYLAPMPAGFENLWDNASSTYFWAYHDNGFKQPNDWSALAPDTMEQGWAVSFGVATGDRATNLLQQIDSQQPNWDHPSITGNYDVVPMGWGFYTNGNVSRAQSAANNYRSDVMASNRAWPYTPSAAGSLIILETNGENLVLGD